MSGTGVFSMSSARPPKIMTGREGGWLWWLGHPARCFATGKDTADTYALVWGKFPPGNGAPPHSHIFHEGFYVVGGEITVIAGNKNVALKTGGFVHIAGGTRSEEHTSELQSRGL